ncbi:hypothetical protein Dimus_032567 [Dionaea muscipula]
MGWMCSGFGERKHRTTVLYILDLKEHFYQSRIERGVINKDELGLYVFALKPSSGAAIFSPSGDDYGGGGDGGGDSWNMIKCSHRRYRTSGFLTDAAKQSGGDGVKNGAADGAPREWETRSGWVERDGRNSPWRVKCWALAQGACS